MRKLVLSGIIAASVAFAGTAMAADGAAIFKAKCSPCHGPEGQGTAMAPAFQGNEFIKKSSVEDIAKVVKNGREGAAKKYKQFAIGMPAQKTMSDDDIKAVIGHEKELANKK